jgi:hypothetical protein
MVICTIKRIDGGMWRRIKLIDVFANDRTTVNETHIVNVVASDVVTARAEQIPRICNVIGFSAMIGRDRRFVYGVMAKSPRL